MGCNVHLKDLTGMGYIVSEVDGTVYLTRLDSEYRQSVTTVSSRGYIVKDVNS